MAETAKVESLLRRIEQLEDAVFIRNKKEHNCRAAAQHLRDKWEWKREQITTARDFIRIAATKSSASGRPYLIRFKDGREVRSSDFLLSELQRISITEVAPKSLTNPDGETSTTP